MIQNQARPSYYARVLETPDTGVAASPVDAGWRRRRGRWRGRRQVARPDGVGRLWGRDEAGGNPRAARPGGRQVGVPLPPARGPRTVFFGGLGLFCFTVDDLGLTVFLRTRYCQVEDEKQNAEEADSEESGGGGVGWPRACLTSHIRGIGDWIWKNLTSTRRGSTRLGHV